mmetsp:Transcript_30515/g.59724  ORF Transcript_30515/g.59724 Transcript_30515/m.59724 type:complete len:203 (-) Transcript_30515:111-719(-)
MVLWRVAVLHSGDALHRRIRRYEPSDRGGKGVSDLLHHPRDPADDLHQSQPGRLRYLGCVSRDAPTEHVAEVGAGQEETVRDGAHAPVHAPAAGLHHDDHLRGPADHPRRLDVLRLAVLHVDHADHHRLRRPHDREQSLRHSLDLPYRAPCYKLRCSECTGGHAHPYSPHRGQKATEFDVLESSAGRRTQCCTVRCDRNERS